MPSFRAWSMSVARRIVKGQPSNLHEYRLDSSARSSLEAEHRGDLAKIFFGPKTRLVDKWLHYLSLYERFFSSYRGKDLKFLEIGVFKGGSLEMWRQYFGPEATIYGIDIDPACVAYETAGTKVRIGSQADPVFLKSVVEEMGAPDIILDDGSHRAEHQRASFHTLFPLLKDGGLYVIEDIHTSYLGEWGGGYRRKGTAVEIVKDMIDDMHAWYHRHGQTTPGKTQISGICVFDSIVFIEKNRKERPGHIRIPATL